MTDVPYYETNAYANVSPVKSWAGNERLKTITLYASTVAVDSKLRKRLAPGSLMVKITSGVGINKYGPYDKTASDGRESPAVGGVAFTWEAHDVTLQDRAAAGLYAQVVFDKSELTMFGYSLHGASLTALEAMFPTCIFDD